MTEVLNNPISHQQVALDIENIRKDFPILQQFVGENPLVYLDNAATSQKPNAVIDALTRYYKVDNANVHRGIHTLSERATQQYERARITVQQFINASSNKEIVFVRGATEAINLVAYSYLQPLLQAGDEIIVSQLEHHSNIVPWQLLAEQTQAKIVVLPINEQGELCVEQLPELITKRTKLLAVGHISNALGTINPLHDIIAIAHRANVPVLVDGAQAAPHTAIDVQALDCDFYVFSGHKVYGPTGIGVLYAKQALLNTMRPYQGGGEMILRVSFSGTTYNVIPHKFEAGTPNIAGAIGLAAALEYIQQIGIERIAAYEHSLLEYATQRVKEIPHLTIIGTASSKASIISFTLGRIHPHDIGTVLNKCGIAIRSGHHCAMPVMDYFKIPATARMSFAFYNTRYEVDLAIDALFRVRELLG
ncbi:MAG: cysteine desulfurase [Gammaproteobacteria bacterium]